MSNTTKQKKGFWLFIFSLIPGAGELYMGFKKQGLSIMFLFWGIIALASGLNFGWVLMLLPILWFYSFFNVHNLKDLEPEEFYAVEDSYVFHLDQFLEEDHLLEKYRPYFGLALILIGISALWNIVVDLLVDILPYWFGRLIYSITYWIPQALIAVLIIFLGYSVLKKSHSHETISGDSSPGQEAPVYRTPQEEKPFVQAENASRPVPEIPVPEDSDSAVPPAC